MKTPADSYTESVHLARPGNANTLGTVFGGDLLNYMDETAAICARRHSGLRVITRAIDKVQFYQPIHVGQVIQVKARAVRVFSTSMAVLVTIVGQDTYSNELFNAAEAWFTIVCQDEQGQATQIPALEPVTAADKECWETAGAIRQQR